MAQHTIIYDLQGPLPLALVVASHRVPRQLLKKVIPQIQTAFLCQFHEYLSQDIIVPMIFEAFMPTLEAIPQSHGVIHAPCVIYSNG